VNFSLFARRTRSSTARPRRTSVAPGVESMETKALMATAAVSSAILALEQGRLAERQSISTAYFAIKADIISIESSASNRIFRLRSAILTGRQKLLTDTAANETTAIAQDKANIVADRLSIRHVIRDDKFVVAQEARAYRSLPAIDRQLQSAVASNIRGVSSGAIDPTTVPTLVSTTAATYEALTAAISTKAKLAHDTLLAVYAAGNA